MSLNLNFNEFKQHECEETPHQFSLQKVPPFPTLTHLDKLSTYRPPRGTLLLQPCSRSAKEFLLSCTARLSPTSCRKH